MAVKYKLIEEREPGVVSGIKCSRFRDVIIALENVMQDAPANSEIVRLDKISSLYPSLSREGTATAEEFNAQKHIKTVKADYRPGKRITNALNAATMQRIK